MGSSRKWKSTRAKSARPGTRPSADEILRKISSRSLDKVSGIPPRILDQIDNQRGVLVTIITLVHCLHVALKHREDQIDEGFDSRVEAGIRWVSLPEMTATILERMHAVLSALDSSNLTKASKEIKP